MTPIRLENLGRIGVSQSKTKGGGTVGAMANLLIVIRFHFADVTTMDETYIRPMRLVRIRRRPLAIR